MKNHERREDRVHPAENAVIGINAVTELLKSERSIDKIFIAEKQRPGAYAEIKRLAKEKGVPFILTDRGKIDRLCPGASHQGVAALTAEADYATIDDILHLAAERGQPPFLLLADKISDPHNLGAMIRCAEGAGVHGIVITKRNCAGVSPVVHKSSAGAVAHLRIARVANLVSAIEELKQKGVWIYGAEAGGSSLYEMDLAGPAAFVMGSEGDGLSKLVKEKCDFLLSIPMYGKVNSFNVSTAAAVILCEAARQRNN